MRAKEGFSSLWNAKGHVGRKVMNLKNHNFAPITVMSSNLEVYLALLSGVFWFCFYHVPFWNIIIAYLNYGLVH